MESRLSTAPAAPAIGVGAIIFDRHDRVLIIRRAHPPSAGLWSLPGGRLEPGEDIRGCCQREVWEETGLDIEPGPLVAVAERRGEGFHYLIVDFAVRLAGEPPALRAASDASAAAWVTLAELPAYPLVDGLAATIVAARACLAGSGGLRDGGEEGHTLYLPTAPVGSVLRAER